MRGRRHVVDLFMRGLCVGTTLVAIVPLVSVLAYVGAQGLRGFSFAYLTQLPAPIGETGGGFGNALVGTLQLVGLACAIALPVGVLAGVYLAEFGDNQLAQVARFAANVMAGVPSIVVGIFVYGVVVLSMRKFSALAGGLALAIVMLPVVCRTTEEFVRLVPHALREAGLALGVPKWRVILQVVLRTGAPGIATGVMLAVARAAGETAPLLFTAFNSRFWPEGLLSPIASLPVHVYTYAVSPYEEWHQQAWAAALVLVAMVLVLNVAARWLTRVRGDLR